MYGAPTDLTNRPMPLQGALAQPQGAVNPMMGGLRQAMLARALRQPQPQVGGITPQAMPTTLPGAAPPQRPPMGLGMMPPWLGGMQRRYG